MNIDWLNVLSTLVATFVGGLAGSWFASRATQKQTQTQIDLHATQSQAQSDLQISLLMKERAFELVQVIDEFVAYSFQKDAPIHKSQRDVISRKLISLCGVLLPIEAANVKSFVWEIRNLHVGKKCKYTFEETGNFFHDLSKKIEAKFFT